MGTEQRGLGRRVKREARRISRQHRQLDELYGLIEDALRRSDPRDARAAFQRFRDALEAHFAMEDEVHFPALHGLRPELEPDLTILVEEHRRFRAQLDDLQSAFDEGGLVAAEADLDIFVTQLAAHEAREEQLIERLRKDF